MNRLCSYAPAISPRQIANHTSTKPHAAATTTTITTTTTCAKVPLPLVRSRPRTRQAHLILVGHAFEPLLEAADDAAPVVHPCRSLWVLREVIHLAQWS